MIGSRYEKTRKDLVFKIKNNLIDNSEEIDEGLCYLCKCEIEEGYLLEYEEEIKGNESKVKFPVHKGCYDLSKNYIFYLSFVLGIN